MESVYKKILIIFSIFTLFLESRQVSKTIYNKAYTLSELEPTNGTYQKDTINGIYKKFKNHYPNINNMNSHELRTMINFENKISSGFSKKHSQSEGALHKEKLGCKELECGQVKGEVAHLTSTDSIEKNVLLESGPVKAANIDNKEKRFIRRYKK